MAFGILLMENVYYFSLKKVCFAGEISKEYIFNSIIWITDSMPK